MFKLILTLNSNIVNQYKTDNVKQNNYIFFIIIIQARRHNGYHHRL